MERGYLFHTSSEIIWAEWDKDISRWFQDDLGVGNLDVSCQGEQSYSIKETPIEGSKQYFLTKE